MLGGGIGAGELVVFVLILLIVFGADKLPEIGRALGRGMKEFRNALRQLDLGEDKERDYRVQGRLCCNYILGERLPGNRR